MPCQEEPDWMPPEPCIMSLSGALNEETSLTTIETGKILCLATRKQFSAQKRMKRAALLVETLCKKENISVKVLKARNRRWEISKVRHQSAQVFVDHYGLSLTETGRQYALFCLTGGNFGSEPKVIV
ncbi:MAG: hypothetical protein JW883_16595 [Deltaproteobacteria bacterium]|nr:hypothetical protein [Deltaproteobacteria bacterium]